MSYLGGATVQRLRERVRIVTGRRGRLAGLRVVPRKLWYGVDPGFARLLARGDDTFAFDGATYRHARHRYNRTWNNERAVEIPIALAALAALDAAGAAPVLEVGNVLSHYRPGRHTIVDKYEVAPGVVNADVCDFRPAERFALILCISTIEHVGFDEEPRDAGKAARALGHLRTLLAPGGRMLVTVPVDYNPGLDAGLREGSVAFDRLRFLRRADAANRWREAGADEAFACGYDDPYPMANALAVAWIYGPPTR